MADDVNVLINEHGLPMVKAPDQPMRILGLTPPKMTCALPSLEASQGILPESEWREISMAHFKCPVLDQGQSSACTGFGSKTIMERARLISGQDPPPSPFSPWGIYELVNHGKDGGADPEEVATALVNIGCPVEGNVDAGGVPSKLWLYPSLQQYPVIWTKAARFKLSDAFHFRTWEGLCTALTLGFNCGLGIPVATDFMKGKVDGEDVIPWTGQFLGYHWIEVHGLQKSPKYGWTTPMQNSWWTTWGALGFAKLVKQHFQAGTSLGFACRAQMDDPASSTTDIPPITG